MKRLLVTGAGGFIGRCSVPVLLAMGFEVHAVLSGKTGVPPPVQLQGARLHAVDLLDDGARNGLLDTVSPSHLLHFAWIAAPGCYRTSAENFRWLEVSRQLLQRFHANGGSRIVMAGSCAEYDWSQVSVCHEYGSAMVNPGMQDVSPYAACKSAMQRSLESFSRAHGLSSAWGRVFFQYGPGEHPGRLVPSVIIRLLSGREALCSDGRQIRSFLHVADVADAFACLLQSRLEGPVNIGSSVGLPVADLIARIANHIGRADLVRLGARPSPSGEPPILLPDVTRLQDELAWRPSLSLEQGLENTIGWWRDELQSRSAGVP